MAESEQLQMARHRTVAVTVGSVAVGGDALIVVQSMTDTDTANVETTVTQVQALAAAGSELVRITVNTEEAAANVGEIQQRLLDLGCAVPLVGDFHYNGHLLLTRYPECARALAKYRINPGNVGFADKRDPQFQTLIKVAQAYDKPVRIGVNWGSVDKALLTRLMDENARRSRPQSAAAVWREALVTSVLSSAEEAERLGLPKSRIVISCKVSVVPELIAVYRILAQRSDYALHLGLTEAGMGSKGIVASSIAMGVLLHEGIGDTIRTSLTPAPGADRVQEVIVSQQILQTLGLRAFAPMVSACPGCGRTTSVFFRELAEQVESHLRARMTHWRHAYVGAERMTVAVMGCVVNGPGESKHANIGISLPGTGEGPVAPLFVDGEKVATLRGDDIAAQFIVAIEQYVQTHYPARVAATV